MTQSSPLLLRWFAAQTDISHRRMLLSASSAFIAIALVTLVSQLSLRVSDIPFIVASMGASAVLLFVIPTSTLSSPWAFTGGHLISVTVGITCARWIPNIPLAAAATVSLAILAMFYLRCLHPPGGAAALVPVFGGDSVHALGYQFLVTPVLINVAVMLTCALLYWRLTGVHLEDQTAEVLGLDHRWQRDDQSKWAIDIPFSHDDLAHAMADMDTYLDISQHDLVEIYARALHKTHHQALDGLCCADIMSQPVISVAYGTELEEAWQLFEHHNIRSLPVVDSFQRVQGILTVTDFVHMARQFAAENKEHTDTSQHIARRLAWLRQRTPGFESNKPEVAGQLMTAPAITARPDDSIIDLLPVFSQHAVHHLPVVDASRKLVGMVTREDVLAARFAQTRTS
jgi:CBS domain-containing membrane protein